MTLFLGELLVLSAKMAPYLLFGFLLAGVIHVWIPDSVYVPKISKPDFKSVVWAAIFGVPLPICSCGVIPTAIAINREGASKGASVSFLISTPATGVDSILATYSLLGLPFAILRPVAAFCTALLGGIITNVATKGEAVCESCLVAKKPSASASFVEKIKATLNYGFVVMVGNISKWLCIGLLAGAFISVFVPADFFLAMRSYPLLSMFVVLIIAMPMYTCAMGSIPLALALVAKGLTPGAALVLLMAGPATSIASMLIVGKAFGRRTLIAYLLSIAFGALFFGFIVDTFFMNLFLDTMLAGNGGTAQGHGALGLYDYLCAGFLVLLMIYSNFVKKVDIKEHHKMQTYKVMGMSCSHCKVYVEKAVGKLSGVEFAVADVSKEELYIEGSVDEKALKAAIEDAGFEFSGKA